MERGRSRKGNGFLTISFLLVTLNTNKRIFCRSQRKRKKERQR